MNRAILVLVVALVSGCGLGVAPAMSVAAECTSGDLTVQVEAGVGLTGSDCPYYAQALAAYEAEYDARFGHQGPVTARVRGQDALKGFGEDVVGHTYDGAIIDLVGGYIQYLPHELNHIRRGPGHGGWCLDFEPWSLSVLGVDQSSYLGCSR